MDLRRIRQVCKYGWKDAEALSKEDSTSRGQWSIYCDILRCFFKYNVWSNQYKKENLHLLSGEQKNEICLKYQEKNLCTNFIFNDRFRTIESKSLIEEIDKWYKSPCIIHFNTVDKPWFANSDNINRGIWRKYRDETKWKGYLVKKKDLPIKEKLQRAIACMKYGVTSYTFVKYNKKYQLKEG